MMDFEKTTEMIIQYLDGELSYQEEEELFNALATNEELRNIMREHLTIARTIRNDFDAYQPPTEATLNILTSLGISPAINNNSQPTTSDNSILSKTKKFAPYILLVLITSLLTYFVTSTYLKHGEPKTEVVKSIVQTPPVIIATPMESNETLTKNKSHHSIPVAKSEKSIAQENSFQFVPKNSILNEKPIAINETKSNQFSFQKELYSNRQNHQNYSYVNRISIQTPFVVRNNEEPRNIFFTIRGITGKSFPNPNISSSDKFLSNASVGLYFTQWDNVKFGIEFGNEVFGLSYLNVKDGVEFTYEQKPSIYWGAVAIDYSLPAQVFSIPGLHPFATVLAGSSQIGGPLFKGIIGLKYHPFGSNFEMYLGSEGSLLFYQNQKNYYLTRKLGLTYGLSIIF